MGWFTQGYDALTDKLELHKCVDGSSRFLLKDPKDLPVIFDQYFKEWKLKINAGLKMSKKLADASFGTEVGQKAQVTHDKISSVYEFA